MRGACLLTVLVQDPPRKIRPGGLEAFPPPNETNNEALIREPRSLHRPSPQGLRTLASFGRNLGGHSTLVVRLKIVATPHRKLEGPDAD